MEIKKLKMALAAYGDDLQLYSNGIAEDALAELAQTEEKIELLVKELFEKFKEKGIRPEKSTLEYIERLRARIAELRKNVFEEEFEKLKSTLTELTETSNKFWVMFFTAANIKVLGLSSADRAELAKYGIYNGNTLQQIFDKLKQRDTERIFDTISDDLQKGVSLTDALSKVKVELKNTRRYVKSEIDAVVNGAANDAAIAFALKNKLLLRYTTAMDKFVCPRCRDLNDKLFAPDSPDLPVLPRHYNCRCQLVPVKSESSAGDGKVPGFKDYLASLPKAQQKKRLGKAKYALWSKNAYTLQKYEEPLPGQRVSLDELLEHGEELLS